MSSAVVGLGSGFSPPVYFSVGSDLQIRRLGKLELKDWAGATRVREEPTETLLALNLEALTGLPLVWLRFSAAMDPSVDMVATDGLGRVHLFELKKASVGLQEASQLEQYLLGRVFDDPERFLAEAESRGRRQSEPEAVTRRLVGLGANQRMVSFGRRNIIRLLGSGHGAAQSPTGGSLTAVQWKKLGYAEQTRRLHAALLARASQEGVISCPNLDWAAGLASGVSAVLRAAAFQVVQVGAVQPAVVLWLVGRSIQDKALDRIRQWRRAGLDARPLLIEVRRTEPGWLVRVQREKAGTRSKLERRLLRATTLTGLAQARVRLHLYKEEAPSSPHRRGGQLLTAPYAAVTLPDGTREKITA